MLFGFIAPVLAPVAQPAATYVGSVVATGLSLLAGAVIGGAIKPKAQPTVSIESPISFKPWGDDPYESTPQSGNALVDDIKETLVQAPASFTPSTQGVENPYGAPINPGPAATDIRPAPPQQSTVNPPQTDPRPGNVPIGVPSANLPGGGQQVGGWAIGPVISAPTVGIELEYRGNTTGRIQLPWNRIIHTYIAEADGYQYVFRPVTQLQAGNTITFRKIWPGITELPPKESDFVDYLWYVEFGEAWVRNTVDSQTGNLPLERLPPTFKPGNTPQLAPQPQVEPKKKRAKSVRPIAVAEAEPLQAPKSMPIVAPPPVKLPTISPEVAPILEPNEPQVVPILDSKGKKPQLAPVTVTSPTSHVFGTAGGVISSGGIRPTVTGVANEVGRIEQKLNRMGQQGAGDVDLSEILLLLTGIANLLNSVDGGTTYKLEAACECDGEEDCEEPIITKVIPPSLFGGASIARLDAIAELLQPLKTWKQPICRVKPELKGDFRTISFVSTERTTAGDRYLSKRFRYRSESGSSLDTLVDHWKDFQWDAGPVCVQHSGYSWGTPQVWAASVDEGKRVISHAGREAGIDPNQVGKWTVSGSNNPRFGLSGRMRVNTKGGYYWITERLGSDARPLVALL